jgi:hypothetical protein
MTKRTEIMLAGLGFAEKARNIVVSGEIHLYPRNYPGEALPVEEIL